MNIQEAITPVEFLQQKFVERNGSLLAEDWEQASNMQWDVLWDTYEMGHVDVEFRPQVYLEEVLGLKE
jgi:hypothetical protein